MGPNKRIYKKRGSKKRAKKAGEFVKTGTYGCVFRPPLKCNNPELNDKFNTGYVSKLMKRSTFKTETAGAQGISKIFEQEDAAWVQKYFVIPLKENGCNINLQDETNQAFIRESNTDNSTRHKEDNCKFLWSDIESNPDAYKSLNQVDGGIDLEEYLRNKDMKNLLMDEVAFNILNDVLIDLLVNGIYKMNNLGIYHFDIKAGNIVYNEAEGQMRLIDWGFVAHIDAKKINSMADLRKVTNKLTIPTSLYYGAHYGNVLLNDDFTKVNRAVEHRSPTGSIEGDKKVIRKIFRYQLDPKFQLIQFFNAFYPSNKDQILNMVTDQYKVIVEQPKLAYFKRVFFPNSDIFAFILIYLQISLIVSSKLIKQNINKLMLTYIFADTYSKNPYNINNLVYSLRNLSKPDSPVLLSSPTSLSPNTALLKQKLTDGKISRPEYDYLIKMNADRKAESFEDSFATQTSRTPNRDGTGEGNRRKTPKIKNRGSTRRRRKHNR